MTPAHRAEFLALDTKAEEAAKEAYATEFADCIAQGMDQEDAHEWAQDAGNDAYDAEFYRPRKSQMIQEAAKALGFACIDASR